MSLSQNGYDFNAPLHDPIVCPESPDIQIVESAFFGVKGVAHLLGETGASDLFCVAIFRGYNTQTLLQADLDEIRGKALKLTGTLTETISGNTRTFAACTFLGLTEIPPRGGGQTGMFYDGSGVHKWMQYGVLRWRKRGG